MKRFTNSLGMVAICLVAYVVSYLVWVPIAQKRFDIGSLSNTYFFANPRTQFGRDFHVTCCYFYYPLTSAESMLGSDRSPSPSFPIFSLDPNEEF
ncbi:hypothetical protein Pan181_51600 [Aeoliella mucimassa]|uniref:Uncharacterized protein n=1 Tax=Aeoliella mucimassa TaxID=2527972 RepID=A0A518AW05_9BACT|nr:hypothetical protein Pan181_51600 [Aeoliella mucimassa]